MPSLYSFLAVISRWRVQVWLLTFDVTTKASSSWVSGPEGVCLISCGWAFQRMAVLCSEVERRSYYPLCSPGEKSNFRHYGPWRSHSFEFLSSLALFLLVLCFSAELSLPVTSWSVCSPWGWMWIHPWVGNTDPDTAVARRGLLTCFALLRISNVICPFCRRSWLEISCSHSGYGPPGSPAIWGIWPGLGECTRGTGLGGALR